MQFSILLQCVLNNKPVCLFVCLIIVYITLILVAVVTYGFCTFLAFWLSFPTFLNNNTKKTKYNFRSHLILNKLSKLGKCQLASKSPMRTVLF